MKSRIYLLRAMLIVSVLLLGNYSFSQSTDASATGTVINNEKKPLAGATVIITNSSTGFKSTTQTNASGVYLFRQLPLGTPYTIQVSFIGFKTQQKENISINLGDQILSDFILSDNSSDLSEIVIRSNSVSSRIDRFGATTAINANTIRQIPARNRNFNDLASLSPLSNGSNLGGQRFSSTSFLIDGVSARNNLTSGEIGRGPFSLSMEAIREFEIITNVYSVTQGRQGGGAISAVTKSGTNTFTGSVFNYFRSDALASKYDIRGNRRTQKFSNNQYGFSLGGPIIKNKLHFFTAFDREDASAPFFIADIRTDADANSLRISKEALEQVLTIARNKYGLSNNKQVGEFGRKTTANTLLVRLDWQINEKNRLTFRNNFSNWNDPTSVNDNSNINLFEVWGDFKSQENSSLLSLRTQVNRNVLNELKVQYQTATRNFVPNSELPAANIPRAIVTVRSTLPNGTQGNTTVQLGGQRFNPEDNLENQWQLINTTFWTKGKYNFTFGTDNTLTYLDTYISNEQNGRFIFNSIAEFDNLNPSRYAREVPLKGVPSVQQYVFNGSLFGEMQFSPWKNVDAVFGLRWDVTSYLTAGDYNPVVEQELGLRTDNNPTDWNNIQPRVQFTWDVKGKRTDVFKFGAGMFSANPITYAQVNNIQNSGTMVAAIDVTRPTNGSPNLVPVPNFPSYRDNPSTAPGLIPGVPTVSTINLNDPNLQVPSIFKMNLSYNKILLDGRLRLGVNLLCSYTYNNYVYLDRNIVDQPFFRLANEANRGVFVPAESISAAGITNNVLSRKTQAVGRTLEFTNGAKLFGYTAIIDGEYRYFKDGYINFSYTYNITKDNTSYNGNVANTSTFRPVKSDPRDLSEINFSDNQFKHKLVFFGSTPTWKGFSLSGRYTGIGGTRYSLTIDADTNGDFVGGPGNDNDLAFIFDPNDSKTPSAIKASMEKVLSNPDNRAKDYIRNSLGKIADRNGGENPFAGTIDLRLTKDFKITKKQKLTISIDVFNFANLLNKEWGRNFNLGTQNLLFVTGFDQATKQYNYRVNENVGVQQANGTPYQIQIGARYGF
ncbi:carboxypeptidase-like regulatory domain-containing protein [Lacibacter sp.]|uniref:TonB-dependent receptor n=1 Tax=Lacibacter sp. TaxID=1915409 RepID=UPI002B4B368C|nr:carboxypeptidase-like regulatory domain-containing protein [Lacibacter sp.]HLP36048.1 carboxypeptidase-like regulatory domain-containing protein [Lacibacter sp.]